MQVFWGPGAALGSYFRSSWRYVGLCWAIFATFLLNFAKRWGYVAPFLVQNGGQEDEQDAKMCRHGLDGARQGDLGTVAGNPDGSHFPLPGPLPLL